MALVMSVAIHTVSDAEGGWVTREGRTLANAAFWYNPNSGLTLADVVNIIEHTFSPIRISYITVRGIQVQRQQLANYRAADYLIHNEVFNCHRSVLCMIL